MLWGGAEAKLAHLVKETIIPLMTKSKAKSRHPVSIKILQELMVVLASLGEAQSSSGGGGGGGSPEADVVALVTSMKATLVERIGGLFAKCARTEKRVRLEWRLEWKQSDPLRPLLKALTFVARASQDFVGLMLMEFCDKNTGWQNGELQLVLLFPLVVCATTVAKEEAMAAIKAMCQQLPDRVRKATDFCLLAAVGWEM